MSGGRHNAETTGTGNTPSGFSDCRMAMETRPVTQIDGSGDGWSGDVTLCSSWWSGTTFGPVGMCGGLLPEWNMAGVTAIAPSDRIGSGHAGFRMVSARSRCGRGRDQEMNVSRVSVMHLRSATVGGARHWQPAVSVGGEQRRHASRAGGEVVAGGVGRGDLLMERCEWGWVEIASVERTCDREERHGIEHRSWKRGERVMGRGMTQLMTLQGACRLPTGTNGHMTHGVTLRKDVIASSCPGPRRETPGGDAKPSVSDRGTEHGDRHRWRRQIGRRRSGEDPEAATPRWAGRWCEASP